MSRWFFFSNFWDSYFSSYGEFGEFSLRLTAPLSGRSLSNKAAHHITAKIWDAGCIRLHVCSTPSKSPSWTLDQPGTVSGQRAARTLVFAKLPKSEMVPKECGFKQSETACGLCARIAWYFPCLPATARDGEFIQMQYSCQHLDKIRHHNLSYVTTKQYGTSTYGCNNNTIFS